MDVQSFLEAESKYRGSSFSKKNMTAVVDNYQFKSIDDHWTGKKIPDVLNREPSAKRMNDNLPSVGFLFDHFYGMKTESGETVWATCPYSHGYSVDMIWGMLAANGLFPIEIIGKEWTPYADLMILFDPNNVSEAYAA